MSITALKTLVNSSKATVLVAVLALATVALWKGLISKDDWTNIVEILVPGWMLAHAGEQGAKHVAEAKRASAPAEPPAKE